MITNSYSFNISLSNVDPSYSAPSNKTSENGFSSKANSSSNDSNVNEFGDTFEKSYRFDSKDGSVAVKMPLPSISDQLPEIDSLVGYSASQVETFYLQGRISKYDYDTKMEDIAEYKAVQNADVKTLSDYVEPQLGTREALDNNDSDSSSQDSTVEDTYAVDSQTEPTYDTSAFENFSLDMGKLLQESNAEAIYQTYTKQDNPDIDFSILENVAAGNEGGNIQEWDLQLGA